MPEGLAPRTETSRAGHPPLLAAVRDALRSTAGRVVLRVPAAAPQWRRVARALLLEGAQAAGGTVVDGHAGDLLLLGAEAGRAERLRLLLDRLLGGAATIVWSLECDAPLLLDYVTGGQPVSAPPAVAAPPDLTGLDAWIAAVPLVRVVRRQTGMRLAQERLMPQPCFLRLAVARDILGGLLGALGRDSDLLDHAARGVGERLLKAISDPTQRHDLVGDRLPGPLHLPAPSTLMGGHVARQAAGVALVATVALEEAADPAALAARRAGLAGLGCCRRSASPRCCTASGFGAWGR
jgi:hypothetical protein